MASALKSDGGAHTQDMVPAVKTDGADYLPQLMAEKDNLDASFIHSNRLLSEEIERVNSGAEKHSGRDNEYIDPLSPNSLRLRKKVKIPLDQFPKFNFVGLLLGPKGSTFKQLQETTGTRMSILGKGSVRDKAKEEELKKSNDPKYAHLAEDLHVQIDILAPPADAHARLSHALSELSRYLNPENNEVIRQQQYEEIAFMNGQDPSTVTVHGRGRGEYRGRGAPTRGRGGPPAGGRGGPPAGGRGGPPTGGLLATPPLTGRQAPGPVSRGALVTRGAAHPGRGPSVRGRGRARALNTAPVVEAPYTAYHETYHEPYHEEAYSNSYADSYAGAGTEAAYPEESYAAHYDDGSGYAYAEDPVEVPSQSSMVTREREGAVYDYGHGAAAAGAGYGADAYGDEQWRPSVGKALPSSRLRGGVHSRGRAHPYTANGRGGY